MGPFERAIRASIAAPATLRTPSRGAPFVVHQLAFGGIVLLLGATRAWTPLSWECVEGIAPFLRGKGFVLAGSTYNVEGDPSTLDGYLKGCTKRATANWVCAVLAHAGVVDLDVGPPLGVRLRN